VKNDARRPSFRLLVAGCAMSVAGIVMGDIAGLTCSASGVIIVLYVLFLSEEI
jgi:hypothetical protein